MTRPRKKGERPNGYPNDVIAPDGVPEFGWRKVRNGGVVKFAGEDFQDDALIPFVGKFVCVRATCYDCVRENPSRSGDGMKAHGFD